MNRPKRIRSMSIFSNNSWLRTLGSTHSQTEFWARRNLQNWIIHKKTKLFKIITMKIKSQPFCLLKFLVWAVQLTRVLKTISSLAGIKNLQTAQKTKRKMKFIHRLIWKNLRITGAECPKVWSTISYKVMIHFNRFKKEEAPGRYHRVDKHRSWG